jgi:Type IV secretion system pilin
MKPKITLAAMSFLRLLPLVSHAAGPLTPGTPVTQVEGVSYLFCMGLKWFYTFVLVMSIIFILVSAFQYMSSGGSEEKVDTARKILTYAMVGIAVALLAAGVPSIVNNLVGGTQNVAVLSC